MLHSIFIMKNDGRIVFEKNLTKGLFDSERIINLTKGLLFSYLNFSRDVFSEKIRKVEFDRYVIFYYPLKEGYYHLIFVNEKNDTKSNAVISFLTALVAMYLQKLECEDLEDLEELKEKLKGLSSFLEQHMIKEIRMSIKDIFELVHDVYNIIKDKIPPYEIKVEERAMSSTNNENKEKNPDEVEDEIPILNPLEHVTESFFNGNLNEVFRVSKKYFDHADQGDIFKAIYLKACIIKNLLNFANVEEEIPEKRELLNILTKSITSNDRIIQIMRDYLITIFASLYYPELLVPEELREKIAELTDKIVKILSDEALRTEVRDAFIIVTFPLDYLYADLAKKFLDFLSPTRERLPYVWVSSIINNLKFEEIKYKALKWEEIRDLLFNIRKKFYETRKNYIKVTKLLPAARLQTYEIYLATLEYLRAMIDYISVLEITLSNKSLSIRDIEENIDTALSLWLDFKKDLEKEPMVVANDLFQLFGLIADMYYLKYRYFISENNTSRFLKIIENDFVLMLETFLKKVKLDINYPKIYKDLLAVRLFSIFGFNFGKKSKIYKLLGEFFSILTKVDTEFIEELIQNKASFEHIISLLRGLMNLYKSILKDEVIKRDHLNRLLSYYEDIYTALIDSGKNCDLLLLEQLDILNELIQIENDKNIIKSFLEKGISIYNYGVHNPTVITPTKIELTKVIVQIISNAYKKVNVEPYLKDIMLVDSKLKWAINIWTQHEEKDKLKELKAARTKLKDVILTIT
ncbi:MAG: hypothetical protein ACP6IS_00695 [Candidatus Asgardarchaeia archaeon]